METPYRGWLNGGEHAGRPRLGPARGADGICRPPDQGAAELQRRLDPVWQGLPFVVPALLRDAPAPPRFDEGERVTVPCGILHFPLGTPFPPREWVERGYAVTHWSEMERGGHLAAMEEPELLAADIRTFFRALR